MSRFFRPVLCLALAAGFGIGLFLFAGQAKATPILYNPGDVLVNEFNLNESAPWAEFMNTTNGSINLTGWTLVIYPLVGDDTLGGGGLTNVLSGTVPAHGLFTSTSISLWDGVSPNPSLIQLKYGADIIFAVSYGYHWSGVPYVAQPSATESAYISTYGDPVTFSTTASMSKGWFNIVDSTYDCAVGPGSVAPDLDHLASCLNSEDAIETNIGSLTDPSAAVDLYFEKSVSSSPVGRITFAGPLNLTDSDTVNYLEAVGENMEASLPDGDVKVGLNTTDASTFSEIGATVKMYQVPDIGGAPDLIVRNNAGDIIVFGDGEYPEITPGTYDDVGHTYEFTTSHFTSFQTDYTLQDQIDAADPGDRIFVPSGTYSECLTINKSLILDGDNSSDTFLDITGCGGAGGINITASNVTVSNFTIQSSGGFSFGANAIYVSTDGSITGLVLDGLVVTGSNSWTGINLNNASGRLTNSDIENTCAGVSVANNSADFTIDNNTISNNGVRGECNPTTGVSISDSSDIIITNNIISDNDVGVHVYSGSNAISIRNNTITGNDGSATSDAYGVLNDNEISVDATMNWWGSEAGPSYTESPSSDGDYISDDNVNYSPWYGDAGLTSLRGEPNTEGDAKYYDLAEDFVADNDGYELMIPAGTTVSGPLTWNGDLVGPTFTTLNNPPTRSGYTTTMGDTIEVGFSDSMLTLSYAARLLFPGAAGKHVGYSRPGISFTEITTICGEDDQLWADENLGAEGDCKKDSGEDLVIWTKHFTVFATYDQTQNYSGGGGSATYNQQPPTNPAVVINSGAGSSDSANVTLTLSATGATEMAVANSSDFSGASWETYAASKSWTLFSGVGLKTVYVKFRNSAGSETATVTDTITLNTSEGGVTQPAGTNETAGTGTAPGQTPAGDASVGGIPEFPTSSVVMGSTNATSTLQPGSRLSFSYSYGNETSSTLYVKINRVLTNSKGTVMKKLTAYKTIKKGAVFKADIKEMLSPTLASGVYTMRVKIYNARTGKLLGDNSFKIVVKKKFYTFSALPTANEIAFNETTFKKMKKSVALPGTVSMRYSYKNLTDTKQSIKMVRELIGPDGKILSSRYGRWSMVPGEKYSAWFVQYVSGKLAVGDYQLRVRALDWKTGVLIAENALSFKVEMK